MISRVVSFCKRQPLVAILALALLLRLSAVWNSTGYLMHDDHFLVVETAASWAVGEDYNQWLPSAQLAAGIENPTPHQANLAYPGVVWMVFKGFHAIGIEHPATQMLLMRLLHALYSLLIVYFGYCIALRLSDRRAAIWSGLALAGLALLPNLSVRQLVEVICIPPLMWSTWAIIRTDINRRTVGTYLLAGVGLGLATTFRYQCGIFGIGMAAAILWEAPSNQRWQAIQSIAWLGCSSLIVFSIGQAQDLWLWGRPFAQLQAYFGYNTTHSGGYPQGSWHQYIWTLLGLLIPPFSFAWLFGFFRVTKRQALLVLPALAFLVFHSYFPNRQERFILPAVPFIIVAGTIGWITFRDASSFWIRNRVLEKRLLIVALIFNGLLATGFTLVEGKKSRVDSMLALYELQDLDNFLVVHVDTHSQPPQFYTGAWQRYWTSDSGTDIVNHQQVMCASSTRAFPNYILFFGDVHLGESVETYQSVYPSMQYVQQSPAGKWDQLIAWLNPVNTVERVLIYKVDPSVECESIASQPLPSN
ncbi:MAG: glycosyltransferase family 39 protein [Bacteroidetes bacterium]|jgi:hypothetical protein|nr:glycosyltransferase family 39 protein [Bacteroidota bacterium]